MRQVELDRLKSKCFIADPPSTFLYGEKKKKRANLKYIENKLVD